MANTSNVGNNEVLLAINDLRDDIRSFRKEAREDNKEIWSEINIMRRCQTDLKLAAEKHNGRIHILEEDKRQSIGKNKKIEKHLENEEIHFNKEKALQTNTGYLAKKRLFYAAMGFITILLTLLTGYLQARYG